MRPLALPALCLAAATHAAELHVAPTGDDAGPGAADRPLRTIQRAADLLQPGDSCVIHRGEYRETVRPALSGTPGRPIRFLAAPGETVLIRGTDPVTEWVVHTGMVYRAAVDWPVEQVFVGDCLMPPASYPDWGADPFHPAFIDLEAERCEVRGAALGQPTNAWAGGAIWGLSSLGWVSGSARIVASEPGRLTLDGEIPWWRKGAGRAVLSGAAPALTVAREWYQRDGVLYLWPPGTAAPSVLGVEVTRRRWAFDLSERAHIHIVGLRMHAASVNMDRARDCVLDGVRVRYASFQQRCRGGFNRDGGISLAADGVGIAVGGSRNTVRNSIVSRCTGDGISVWGASNTVENCVVYDCDTSATDCAPITCTGHGHVLCSNTVFNAGRSIILHRKLVGGRIVRNHLYNAGLLCRDLGMTYTYQTDGRGTEIAFNRLHHNFARPPGGVGIYLDDTSQGHIVHHNLVFNTPEALSMNPPNSRNNLVFNNTMIGVLAGIGCGKHAPDSLTGTRIFNNLFRPHISAQILQSPSVFQAHNIANATYGHFTAPGRGDYTLCSDSAAVDAGIPFPPYTDGYIGAAPDLGAFERGLAPWTAGSAIPEPEWEQQAPW